MAQYGRDDYDDKTLASIPSDEPVFIIRGRDRCALVALAAYIEAARLADAHDVADGAEDWMEHIRSWQNGPGTVKTPDLPPRPPASEGARHREDPRQGEEQELPGLEARFD